MNLLCRLGFHNQDDVSQRFLGVGSRKYLGDGNSVRWFWLFKKCSRCGKDREAYAYWEGTPKDGLVETAVGRELLG